MTAYVVVPNSPFETEPDLGSGRQAHVTGDGESKIGAEFRQVKQQKRDYHGITIALLWDYDVLIMGLAITWDDTGVLMP